MIIPITNQSKNFYHHLGKIFGSRDVERLTGDRIYDDDDKVWYLYYNKGIPDTFISVKDNVIKNIWGYEDENIVEVLKHIRKDIKESIVTKHFKKLYIQAGYKITEDYTKKYIKIRGDYGETN